MPGSTSNHSHENSFPEKTNPGSRSVPFAQTHSMIVTSSRFPLRALYLGRHDRCTKYFWFESLHPPPLLQPFSSMLYTFSIGISYLRMICMRRSKCLCTTGLLKAWARFGSRPDGLPSLTSGLHRRK